MGVTLEGACGDIGCRLAGTRLVFLRLAPWDRIGVRDYGGGGRVAAWLRDAREVLRFGCEGASNDSAGALTVDSEGVGSSIGFSDVYGGNRARPLGTCLSATQFHRAGCGRGSPIGVGDDE